MVSLGLYTLATALPCLIVSAALHFQYSACPSAKFTDVPSAWRERQQVRWQCLLEPVVVAWDGEPSLVEVKLPLSNAKATMNCHLRLETGEERPWHWPGGDSDILETAEVEGEKYAVKQLPLKGRLPWGYHRLTV